MDSWVISGSVKAGEGQKGHQSELTHQSKNPVVKAEQSVSSIALTICGAKFTHYQMPFPLFVLFRQTTRRKLDLHKTISSQGHTPAGRASLFLLSQ